MFFLNLVNSIKSYNDCPVNIDNKINENFEKHIKEIEKLNLDNYDECLNKIIEISKNLNNVKKDLISLIEKIEKEEKIVNEKEKNLHINQY